MRVIYTNQSIDSLEEALDFAIKKQGLTMEQASSLKTLLFDRADSLGLNPLKGQQEGYLKDLKEGHRRILVGHFKIIYKIQNEAVYVTDFFYSRQDPAKMKS